MTTDRTVNWFLAAALSVVLVVGVFLLGAHEQRVEQQATANLKTMLMLRESVLRRSFESLRSEVTLWSSRTNVIEIMTRLNHMSESKDKDAISAFGKTSTDEIKSLNQNLANTSLDNRVREFANYHDYYDLFFISPAGDVLYSVAKEADYGTNLLHGPYADSGLGRLFQTLMTAAENPIALEDFSRYAPSDDQPAAFLGARILSDGDVIGVYAIQIPEQPINRIMQFSAGMGESGETYLVGEDGLMRSTSRFFDTSTVLESEVTASTVGKALAGQTGIEIVDDYRGIPVYSAYRLFEFEGIRWAVLAEKDVAEVREPMIEVRLWLAGAFVLLCVMVLMLRFMLIRIVVPSSLAALLGLTFVQMDDSD